MKKGYLIALIGVVAFILVAALVLGVSNGISGITDKLGDVLSDASKDTSSNGSVDVPGGSSGGTSDGSSSNIPSEAQVLRFGDPDLTIVACNNFSGTTAKLGVLATTLKPNTKYRITWKIDPSVEDKTDCFLFRDGSSGYAVEYELDHSAVNEVGFSRLTYGDKATACDNTGGVILTTSSVEGAEFSIWFFETPFVDVATTVAAKANVTAYVTDFSIIEVIE